MKKLEYASIGDLLEQLSLTSQKGHRYLDDSGNETYVTYPELFKASGKIASALNASGVKKGDRVALMLPDPKEFVPTFFGILQMGAVATPVALPFARDGIESGLQNLRQIIIKSGAALLIADKKLVPLIGTLLVGKMKTIVSYQDLERRAERVMQPVKLTKDDLAFLQFTSGSTSQPKGVAITYANLLANIKAIAAGINPSSDQTIVSWLPLFHDMGLIGFVIAPLIEGLEVTYMPTMAFLKRPLSWLKTISKYKAGVSFAPNFAYALCVSRARPQDLEDLDLSSWRVAGCGAEPIQRKNLENFAKTFAPAGFKAEALFPTYGLAESTLAVSFPVAGTGFTTDVILIENLSKDNKAVKADPERSDVLEFVSCGSGFKDHELRIFDEDLNTLPERTVGQIVVKGPSVMKGYFEDEPATTAALKDGWLLTGDLGYLADNQLYICGRLKDLIIINGRNYYPSDIENAANTVEGVRNGGTAAFSITDSEQGRELAVLCFETKLSSEQYPQLMVDVRSAVFSQLGVNTDILVPLSPGTLPKTSSGKIQRSKTKELFLSGVLGSANQSPILEKIKVMASSRLHYLRSKLSK